MIRFQTNMRDDFKYTNGFAPRFFFLLLSGCFDFSFVYGLLEDSLKIACCVNLLADMIVIDENPLHNLKVLYGNGHMKLNDETMEPERIGGVKYTIKDGIVYDAKQMLRDIEEMVNEQKRERGITELPNY